MSRQQATLWGTEHMTMERSIELTRESLHAYGARYRHWALAYSGGKDSTAAVTLVVSLIATGQIPQPDSLVRAQRHTLSQDSL